MGYESYEQPMVSTFIYYYDKGNCTSLEFGEKILLVFKKYGYDITNIELGKHKLVNDILENYVVRLNKKQLSTIDLKTEMFKWINDDEIGYISFIRKEKRTWMCDVTWHKNYKLPDGVQISDYTFNHLHILSSYENLDSKEAQKKYIGLSCELADLFTAFYGRIEDVSTAVDLLDRTKEKVFNSEYLQTVYWGNYLGKDYCLNIGKEKLKESPFAIKKLTNETAFLAVTDDLFDSMNNCNFRQRKKLFKYLKGKKQITYY